MSESSSRVRRLRSRCPHCRSTARLEDRKTIEPVYDELYFQCTNILCGHTWKAGLCFVHTISPSAMPRADLNLPLSPRVKTPAPANDPAVPDVPAAANDAGHSPGSTEAG
ncbi:ogr/Delta-like zinc finger family protein [Sphingomonas sp. PR090111-T3T-6A]|uniref:ogr/Delta-like zinc finger family protein n=1 Tax=Sphingomonas sp. PR090111-T3T-6A TaxID=685778 RepID=UPI0003752269|nr:ogr/Delta-like zinc finger family protein [Sphingomonas sp. PR090111-T3T-6A]